MGDLVNDEFSSRDYEMVRIREETGTGSGGWLDVVFGGMEAYYRVHRIKENIDPPFKIRRPSRDESSRINRGKDVVKDNLVQFDLSGEIV